jgi:hypothetical protein
MKTQFYSYRIGIKWVQINGLSIRYTNHFDRATVWSSKKTALSWKKEILEKYPIAELVPLKLTPADE